MMTKIRDYRCHMAMISLSYAVIPVPGRVSYSKAPARSRDPAALMQEDKFLSLSISLLSRRYVSSPVTLLSAGLATHLATR
jgi:hypothetical protein